jgi:endonuclease/exonuclease/phosphatase (EEP) superfamily protein YafD
MDGGSGWPLDYDAIVVVTASDGIRRGSAMTVGQDLPSSARTVSKTPWHTTVRRWIVCAIRTVGWAAAAVALIGFAGELSRAADLASHFRVAYAFGMMPAWLTYVREPRTKKRWTFALLTFVLMLDAASIAVLYLPVGSRPDVAPDAPAIHLLQFNTWPKNPNDDEELALVERALPDVVALQETSESLRTVVARRLRDRYRILSVGSELLLIRYRAPGIEFRDWARHPLPGGEAIEADLGIAGRELAVLSFHARAPVGLKAAAVRDAQFEWAAQWCRGRSGSVIVLGDLNATPWSSPFRRLLHDGGLTDSARGFGLQPTWNARAGALGGSLAWPVQIPIDHCLHSSGLVTAARETGPACGSNHFPLFATLRPTWTTTPKR